MSMQCKVCALGPKVVKDLERDYINGTNLLQLAKTYGISRDSVKSHVNHHLPQRIVEGSKNQLQLDSSNMMLQIDSLYQSMTEIFQRNFDKGYDKTALKALAEKRNTLQLLASISIALHRNKAMDMEHEEKRQLTETNIPLERLTKKEQEVYFQINQKLLGNRETIDLSGLIDTDYTPIRHKSVEVEEFTGNEEEVGKEGQHQNSSQNNPQPKARLKRTRFRDEDSKSESDEVNLPSPTTAEEEMSFKAIPKWNGQYPPELQRRRRDFARFVRDQSNNGGDPYASKVT